MGWAGPGRRHQLRDVAVGEQGCSCPRALRGSPTGTGEQETKCVLHSPTLSQPSRAHLPAQWFWQSPSWSHPAPGRLLHQPYVFSGAPMGSWGPPRSHGMGSEPTQLMEKVGLHRVCGCSGRGTCTRGGMTPERSKTRSPMLLNLGCLLGQLSRVFPTQERGAEKEKEHQAPLHLLPTQWGHTSPSIPWAVLWGTLQITPARRGLVI